MTAAGPPLANPFANPLVLTLGEPAGIGPDLTLALWRRRSELALPPFYVVGDPDFYRQRASRLGLDVPIEAITAPQANETFARALPVVPLDMKISAEPGHPDASSAPAAIASIRRAVADVLAGRASAIVTNPVAKNVLYRSGFVEPGHTEFLARLAEEATGTKLHPVMMLWSREFAVVPVTIHLPFKDVVARLTSDLIVQTGRIVARDLSARFGCLTRVSRLPGLIRMPAKTARSARKTATSSRQPSHNCVPTASTRSGRCRPTPCFTPPRARLTTSRCACITTRR